MFFFFMIGTKASLKSNNFIFFAVSPKMYKAKIHFIHLKNVFFYLLNTG